MRKVITLLMLLTLFGGMSSANALSNSERTYQIELVVFSHITAQGLASEEWPSVPINPPPPSAINLDQSNKKSFAILPKSDFFLSTEQRRLERNKNYHVLLHLAWRQRIPNSHHAQPIHVYGGNIYNSSGNIVGTAIYGQQPYNPDNVWQLNGTITPMLSHYIDIKMNLLFAQPFSSLPTGNHANNIQGQFAYFQLKQTRRMRSRELNYIGHPLYGVLIKVVPIE